jgi:hypothetical protein
MKGGAKVSCAQVIAYVKHDLAATSALLIDTSAVTIAAEIVEANCILCSKSLAAPTSLRASSLHAAFTDYNHVNFTTRVLPYKHVRQELRCLKSYLSLNHCYKHATVYSCAGSSRTA